METLILVALGIFALTIVFLKTRQTIKGLSRNAEGNNCAGCGNLGCNHKESRKDEQDMTRTLKDLSPGESGKIKLITGNGPIRRRIMDMGLVPGTELTMERYAPMGDPVEVKNKGYHLSLRKQEADTIILE